MSKHTLRIIVVQLARVQMSSLTDPSFFLLHKQQCHHTTRSVLVDTNRQYVFCKYRLCRGGNEDTFSTFCNVHAAVVEIPDSTRTSVYDIL